MVFASASVPRHLARGLVGVLALATALYLAVNVTPAALALALVTPIAWRGCPTCWTIGLLATMSRPRACPARSKG